MGVVGTLVRDVQLLMLHDPDAAIWSVEEVEQAVSRTQDDIALYASIHGAKLEELEATATIATVAGTEFYDAAADLLHIARMEYAVDFSYSTLEPLDISAASETDLGYSLSDTATTARGTPVRYYLWGVDAQANPQIGLRPIPDRAGSAKYWYIKRPSAVTEATNRPALPPAYEETIHLGAYARLIGKLDRAAAAAARIDYERHKIRTTRLLLSRSLGQPLRVRYSYRGPGS